jgi:branched-chain amino acid transport system ATP-binding protein
MSQSIALEATDVVVRYHKAVAVRSASISIPAGAIAGLVGPNGAGKSSLLNAIQGVVASDMRSLSVVGRSFLGMSSTDRARSGLILVPQGGHLFRRMTVLDNLRVVADGLRLPADRVDEALDRFPILRERRKSLAGVLSGGERQMLALARALMSRPNVFMLDEPTQGLAPTIIRQIMDALTRISEEGRTVVIAEPTTRVLPRHIDVGFVMLHGRIVARASDLEGLEKAFHEQFEIAAHETVSHAV